jgi:predicted nucleic acid-binding protein
VPQVFSYDRDPKDARYVNLAIAAEARYLVTWDRDLLALADASRPEGREFQAAYAALRIVTPSELLRDLPRIHP